MSEVSQKAESVKRVIRSLLISAPSGLTLNQLCTDFKTNEGYELPYSNLGYPTASAFLKDCPDVAESTFHHGTHMLRGVSDESTDHIESLVARQKKNTKKPSHGKQVVPLMSIAPRFINKKYQPSFQPKSFTSRKNVPVVPANIKQRVTDLLQEYCCGVRIDNFSNAWRKKFGVYPDFNRYGFSCVEELLKSLPDDVLFTYNKNGAVIKLKHSEIKSKSKKKAGSQTFTTEDFYSYPDSDLDSNDSHSSLQGPFDEDTHLINPKLEEAFLKVLRKHPNGIWASRFSEIYELETKKSFRHNDLGYFSIIDMAAAHPRIFEMHRSGEDDWLLFEKGAKVNIARNKNENMEDENLMKKITKTLNSERSGILLSEFPSVYQKVNGESLNTFLTNSDNLEKFMSDKFSDNIHFDHSNGGVTLCSKIPVSINQVSTSKYVAAVCAPSDIATSDKSYVKVKLPSEEEISDGYIEIFICEVKTPSMFWFFMNGEKYNKALDKLMDDLELFYYGSESNGYIMPESAIMIGHVCVAIFPDDKNWHRCIITGIRDARFVEVSYVDYGTTGLVKKSDLRYLRNKFLELPSQALTGTLANITWASGDSWSIEAGNMLLRLVKDKVILAKIQHQLGLISSVILCDTNIPDKDIFINDEMVRCGYAKFTTNEPKMASFGQLSNSLLPSMLTSNLLCTELARFMQYPNPLTTALTLQMLGNNLPLDAQMLSSLANLNLQGASSLSSLGQSSTPTSPGATQKISEAFSNSETAQNRPPAIKIDSAQTELRSSINAQKPVEGLTLKNSSLLKNNVIQKEEKVEIKKRFIKRVQLKNDIVIHIINFEEEPYMTSGEISSFFWQKDNLRKMLRVLNFKCPCLILDQLEHPWLFQLMATYDIPGIKEPDTESVKEMIFMYPLKNVPEIVEKLNYKQPHLKEELKKEYNQFDPQSAYWMGEESCEIHEKCSSATINLDELNGALKYLLLEKKQLMTSMIEDETIKGSDMLKQIEDQIDNVRSQMKITKEATLQETLPDRSQNRSTPDGASDELKSPAPRANKTQFNVNAPEFIFNADKPADQSQSSTRVAPEFVFRASNQPVYMPPSTSITPVQASVFTPSAHLPNPYGNSMFFPPSVQNSVGQPILMNPQMPNYNLYQQNPPSINWSTGD